MASTNISRLFAPHPFKYETQTFSLLLVATRSRYESTRLVETTTSSTVVIISYCYQVRILSDNQAEIIFFGK